LVQHGRIVLPAAYEGIADRLRTFKLKTGVADRKYCRYGALPLPTRFQRYSEPQSQIGVAGARLCAAGGCLLNCYHPGVWA